MIRTAVLTISDSSYVGARVDVSGRVLRELAVSIPGTVEQ